MLRRIQPIAFDGETPGEGDAPSGGDQAASSGQTASSGQAASSGIERRRHPRVRVDAAASEAGYTTDRRKADRRNIDEWRNDLNWTTANTVRDRSFAGRYFGFVQRLGLKPSRVLLLIIALGSGGVAAYLATGQQQPTASEPVTQTAVEVVPEARMKVLVAAQPISVGQRLTQASLAWEDWPVDSVRDDYVTLEDRPEALTEMGDAIARFGLFAGDPVREQKLVRASQGFLSAVLDQGLRGVSVVVSAEAASGGFISPNDHVDVLLTRATPLGEVSDTVLHNVRVLAINEQLGQASVNQNEDNRSNVFTNQAIATLALDPDQAEVITAASSSGRLSLVLRSMSDFGDTQTPDQRATNQAIRMTSPFWANTVPQGNQ